MHQRPYHVLVAEDHPFARHEVISVLQSRDYCVLCVTNPQEVAETMRRWPVDLLITGPRMGSWYGLQIILTSRAMQPELAGILVADRDTPVQQLDAGRHHVAVTSRPLVPDEFLALVAERLASIQRRQRWPRKQLTMPVDVTISGQQGRLVDVSYGGCKVHLPARHDVLSSVMRMSVSSPPIEVDTELIWSAITDGGASCVAGVSIEQDASPNGSWRQFVDWVV